MSRPSYAKLYGVNLKRLRTESPFHPEQIANKWRHEIKADRYWQVRREEAEAEAVLNEAIKKQENELEYFTQIPGK